MCISLSEAGRLAFLGLDQDDLEWFSIGSRAGCPSGYSVRAGRVMFAGPATQDPVPSGTRWVDMTEQALAEYRRDLRQTRLIRAARLGAPVVIDSPMSGAIISSRTGKIRRIERGVRLRHGVGDWVDNDVRRLVALFPGLCSLRTDSGRQHFRCFPGREYARLNNGQLVDLKDAPGRWAQSLIFVG